MQKQRIDWRRLQESAEIIPHVSLRLIPTNPATIEHVERMRESGIINQMKAMEGQNHD